jgi:XTP/dITP diphosphohydrolase
MKEKKEVVIATSNQGKLKEFKRMLEPLGYEVFSLSDEKVDIDVEETGKTFMENSLIKAHCIAKKLPDKIVIADDSGLEVHALNGFPGIYSARFMEGQPYELKRQAIIDKLKGFKDRSANFTSAVSLVGFDNEDHVFVGKTYGTIAEKPSGISGFGYDPIFFSDELKKTFGEATPEEKDSVSHRGRALKQLEEFIKAN